MHFLINITVFMLIIIPITCEQEEEFPSKNETEEYNWGEFDNGTRIVKEGLHIGKKLF